MEKIRQWYLLQPRAIRRFLLANVVVYLLWNFVFVHFQASSFFVYNVLALNPNLPDILYKPWQLVTYSFLHLGLGLGGFLHILFNMLWMMWIGRDYEEVYGSSRLFALYIIGGVGGALMTVFLHGLFPSIGVFGGIVHGASASVLCIMTAVAVKNPEKSIALMFIGVVRLSHVVVGFLVLDILFVSAGGASVSAHWGGASAGYIFARAFLAGNDLSRWANPLFDSRGASRDQSIMHRLDLWISQRSRGGRRDKSMHETSMGVNSKKGALHAETDKKLNQSTIDELLDKISEVGYDALSAEERRILYEAGNDR